MGGAGRGRDLAGARQQDLGAGGERCCCKPGGAQEQTKERIVTLEKPAPLPCTPLPGILGHRYWQGSAFFLGNP